MFKRKNRVPGSVRFKNAYSFFTPLFAVKIKKNELLFNRFTVVVSKKVDKRATVRNKIKRLVRSIFKELDRNMVKGYDSLAIIRKNILLKTKKEIVASLKEGLRKEKLLE